MASRAVRERLAQDIGLWLADGLVAKETHDLLCQRYDARDFGLAQVIKSLGVAGGMIAFFGLLGLMAALSGSKMFAAFLLLAVGAGLTAGGIRLSLDKMGRYSISSKVVLMLGVVMAIMGIGLALDSMNVSGPRGVFVAGLLGLAPVAVLAYKFRNTFLLVLGLIGFFHWVGSWTAMYGQSTYEISIQDPRLMSVAALAVVAAGIYHERALREQTGRFFQAYEAVGMVYLNLSLLILTIELNREWGQAGLWILILTGAAIAQIVAGAALHNPLMTGFGVTTFAINAYTRYYEAFWNQMHAGVFFLLGGLALLGAGLVCELVLKRQRESA
jgi:hypothetical protein